MEQHERRLAAAAYDRGLEVPRCANDRTVLVGVPLLGRTLLGDLTLGGHPPEALRLAVAETLGVLRVMWIALLRCEDGPDRRQLDAVHAALQCELAATEWTWSGGSGDGHDMARTLVRRRERHREGLAAPPPVGLGLLLPRHARANEAFAGSLAAAWEAVARAVAGADRARAARLREDAHDAVGAWRLGEMGAAEAAAAIDAAIGHPTVMRPVAAEELPALRAAS
jgi:hypothetical protein